TPTAPCLFPAFLTVGRVPTATTRTSIPVFLVNSGRICSNRPEFCVEVVDCTMMNLSSATAKRPTTVTSSAAQRTAPRTNLLLISVIEILLVRAQGRRQQRRVRLRSADGRKILLPCHAR